MKFVISILFFSLSFTESYNMQLVGHLPYDQPCADITGFSLHGREIAVVGNHGRGQAKKDLELI